MSKDLLIGKDVPKNLLATGVGKLGFLHLSLRNVWSHVGSLWYPKEPIYSVTPKQRRGLPQV